MWNVLESILSSGSRAPPPCKSYHQVEWSFVTRRAALPLDPLTTALDSSDQTALKHLLLTSYTMSRAVRSGVEGGCTHGVLNILGTNVLYTISALLSFYMRH